MRVVGVTQEGVENASSSREGPGLCDVNIQGLRGFRDL